MRLDLLHILQHALGVDQYGQGRQYRNHFCAGGADVALCDELTALGFMRRHGANAVFPDANFSVTEAGRKAMAEASPKPPKLTRSQQRYRRYLNWADAYDGTFLEFLEYLKHEKEVA